MSELATRPACQGCEEHPIAVTYTVASPDGKLTIQVSLCWLCWNSFVVGYTAELIRARQATRRSQGALSGLQILAKLSRHYESEQTIEPT